MPLSRLFATALWLAVTAASTGIVWMATSAVAADVTDRPASVLAEDDVVDELESAASSTTATTAIAPEAGTPQSTVPPLDPVPVPGPNPSVPPAPTSPTEPPGVTPAPIPPPTTETTSADSPPVPGPADPPASQTPARPTATYTTPGGVVSVACDGHYFITLVSAIPSNGYAVEVVADGPANVEVHFVRRGEDLSVKAFCFGRPIRYYDQRAPNQPEPSEPGG